MIDITKDYLLTPEALATRWQLPLATLSQWRWNGKGPQYIRLGKHILYRLEDVMIFERQKLRQDTACTGYPLASQQQIKRESNSGITLE